MASSFSEQIPTIISIIAQVKPKTILDIGKGFGKYGFLVHEYIGIDNKKQILSTQTLAQQSDIEIDAVEIDNDLLLPHLSHIYREIHVGDVLKIYKDLPKYDLVLMIDIIEHIDKEQAIDLLKYLLLQNSVILIATPLEYFEQHLYDSVFEEHVSHWTLKDFQKLGITDFQKLTAGAVYLLSNHKVDIMGFGKGFIKKLKRIGHAVVNEIK